MKKTGLFLSLLLAASTILGACGTSEKSEKKEDTGKKTEQASDIKVGMVTDVGGVDDKSFNQSAWEGLKKFGADNNLEEGKNFKYLQSQSDTNYNPNLSQFADANFDVIYGIGFLLQPAVDEIAKQYPDVNFALVDSVSEVPNVTSITFKEHEGSFLVGVVAGLSTKTNKLGFIGGVQSDLIKRFETGFIAGVKSVNPKAEVIVQYADSFSDVAKGTSIASAMYGQKADIIYHAAGAVGNGVFTEAKNRMKTAKDGEKVWVIGVDRDQHEEGMPENVTLTSMMKRVDKAVYDVADMAKNKELKGGEILSFGLNEDGVGIAPTKDNVSKEALDKVAEYEAKIKSGEVKVPQNDDELKTYTSTLK